MFLRRHPQVVVVLVFVLATVASLGPHLLILGYGVAGARPPAELRLLCPLHYLDSHPAHPAQRLVLQAKPLT
jgi:hypothetical protein